MPNKKTRPVTRAEFQHIIETILNGFTTAEGSHIRPNPRIAMALVTEANLGLRIGDIVRLHLSDIVFEGGRYHLNIIEEKTRKYRTFTVPTDFYTYLQTYALNMGIKPSSRLFDITVRAVQSHLQAVCDYLKLSEISTHSLRKFFAVSVYTENDYNVELVRALLQHSSVAITQHYLSVEPKLVEQALQNHLILPDTNNATRTVSH